MEYVIRSLGSFSEMKYGKMPNKKMISDKGKYPIFSGYRVVGYCDECNITEEQLIVVARGVGGTGDVKLTPGACYLTNLSIAVMVDENIALKRYLYYYFLNNNLRYLDSGSAQSQITISDLKNVELPIPSLETQKKVVSIFNTIDEMIANNIAINDNLEQQARTLFYEWFIHTSQDIDTYFTELGILPTSFSIMKTGDLPMIVTDYVANGSFASLKKNVRLYQERNYAYFIRNTDLKSGTFNEFVDAHSYEFLSKTKLFGGEIIISNVGDVGSVFLCPVLDAPMTLGNNIIMLRPLQDELQFYLYIWFKWSIGQRLMQGIKGGSVQPKFNKTDFKSLPIIIPPKELLKKFHSMVRPMFDTIEHNHAENRKLEALRDSILPRLMSGEIDVSDIRL